MKALYKPTNTIVDIPGVCNAGVPALFLLQEKAPQARIEVKMGKQGTLVALSTLDLSHSTLSRLNVPQATPRQIDDRPSFTTRRLTADSSGEFSRLDGNHDRAQLAALGGFDANGSPTRE